MFEFGIFAFVTSITPGPNNSMLMASGIRFGRKKSLPHFFGIWLGFHACDQDTYLAIIRGYCDRYGVDISDADLRAQAIEWQATRGSRSGRVAWQFFVDLAGRMGVLLK